MAFPKVGLSRFRSGLLRAILAIKETGWRKDNPAQSITLALPKNEKSKVHRLSRPYAEVAEAMPAPDPDAIALGKNRPGATSV